jgi:YidC/Oxa1 family membrane protein insertase
VDRNLFLAFALSFAVLTGWMLLTAPPPGPPSPAGTEFETFADTDESENALSAPRESLPPSLNAPTADSKPIVERAPGIDELPVEIVELEMPLYKVRLTSRGAGIDSWKLTEFRETSDEDSPLVELITGEAPARTALVTPFEELGLGDLSTRVFQVVDQDLERVVFEITDQDITIRKTFTFDSDSYSFRILLEVVNDSTQVVAPRFRIDLPAHIRDGSDFSEIGVAAMQDGSAQIELLRTIGQAGFLDSLTGGRAERYKKFSAPIDWAAVQTTYFVSAVVADNPNQASVWLEALEPGISGTAQLFFDEIRIPGGSSYARELKAYIGPKEIERLTAFGGDLVRSIDLGWSWVEPLTKFFAAFLKAIYSVIPNYGVAIVILTILVRVVTAPLTMKQMRSMERMRLLAPKLKEIQAEHADDRAKQSEMTMALYKSEGVNPLGGCLPMLLQFPVFIGLFYALRSTIQLRQSPFFGWIDDLASPEMLFEIPGLGLPVRVLPIIMGGTMVLQQKITPMQADPAQAKMMMTVMPVMMTFVFYTFPSGLVLYWMVSNVLAITHQLIIGRGMRK